MATKYFDNMERVEFEGEDKKRNPLAAALGLKRIDGEDEDQENEIDAMSPSKSKLELNRRGIPARKRKKNSLIYGTDDLVSIPVKSPKKRGPKVPLGVTEKVKKTTTTPVSSPKKIKTGASPVAAKKEEDDLELDVEEEDDSFDESEMERDIMEAATAFVDVDADAPQSPPLPAKSPKKRLNFDDIPAAKVVVKSSSLFKRKVNRKRSPKKVIKTELGELELSSPEKKHAQTLGVALRNLLKLPRAHKWVCYEFFYSNLDKVLFEGENDFMVCLRESFPQIKTRRLTRVEWCKIRRLMGKPRRCSSAFFAEERAELLRKRTKIRLLQQRKQTEVINFKDLPDSIPLQLTIGTRVTARLRKPQDGLFMGTVDAYDTSNNTYRVRFDRTGLGGTHSVRDEEVLSVDLAEMLPLSSFMQRVIRPRLVQQPQPFNSVFMSPVRGGISPQLANDPLLSGSTPRGKTMRMDGQVGGYPVKFLEQIVRLSKVLKMKREKVSQLRELNSHGERKKSFGAYINDDFQKRYASTVIELSTINRDLSEHLKNIQDFTQEFALEAGPTISLPSIIREGCQEDAYDMVTKNSSAGDFVQNPKILGLISSFTSLMLHIKQLSDGEGNSFELEALQESLREVKSSISPENVDKFENCVEVHMKHIQSELSQMGNLHAFMKDCTPSKASEILNASGRRDDGSKTPSKVVRNLTPVVMKADDSV